MSKLKNIAAIGLLLISFSGFAGKRKGRKRTQKTQKVQPNLYANLQGYVLRGDVDKVRRIFQQKKPDQKTLDENLFVASGAFGKLPMVQFLIEQGANVNYQDSEGWTPLIEAADEGRADLVEYFLSLDVDLNHKNANGESALYRALGHDHGPVIRLLMQAGATLSLSY